MSKPIRLKSFDALRSHLQQERDPPPAVGATGSEKHTRVETPRRPKAVPTPAIPQVGWWDAHRGTVILHPEHSAHAIVILDSGRNPSLKLVPCLPTEVSNQLRSVSPPAAARALEIYALWKAGLLKDVESIARQAREDAEKRRAEESRARGERERESQRRVATAREAHRLREEGKALQAELERIEQWKRLCSARRDALEPECSRRGIQVLLHFTDSRNAASILQHGLLPRTVLGQQGRPCFISDPERYDGHLDGISLSIEFPNYEMFYRKRRDEPERVWVVFGIDASVLWDMDCSFYSHNAASTECRGDRSKWSWTRFPALFGDLPSIERMALGIPNGYPTHPQSEVLVFEPIPVDRLKFLHYVADAQLSPAIVTMAQDRGIRITADKGYFRPRCDWSFWQPKRAREPIRDFENPGEDIPF